MPFTCGEDLLREGAGRQLGKDGPLAHHRPLRDPDRSPARTAGLPLLRALRPWLHARGSYYSSPATTIPAAERTGRLTLIPNAVVSHIAVDGDEGRCRSVSYLDRVTRAHREVFGRKPSSSARPPSSPRASCSTRGRPGIPNGLGNSSGILGHYLMDHLMGAWRTGDAARPRRTFPASSGTAPTASTCRASETWPGAPPRLHPRAMASRAGRSFDQWSTATRCRLRDRASRSKVRDRSATGTSAWCPSGRSLARFENHCALDQEKVDAWGIPVLRISMSLRRQREEDAEGRLRDGRRDRLGPRGARTSRAGPTISSALRGDRFRRGDFA